MSEIRRIAQGVVDNNTFLGLYTGAVSNVEPLRVRVDSLGVELSGGQLMVASYLQELHMLDDVRNGASVVLLGPVKGSQYYMMDVSV